MLSPTNSEGREARESWWSESQPQRIIFYRGNLLKAQLEILKAKAGVL